MIEIKNVTKILDENVILKNINATFTSGKIYGIVGKNGSGKSVLFKLISGLIFPSDGEILIDGTNTKIDKKKTKQIRAMIDKPNFISEISGLENLLILSEIQKKVSKVQIEKLLSYFEIYDERHKKYGKYSLGMKQKLAIIQVIMEEPDIMIFDEPFNALDEDIAKKTKEMIKSFKNEERIIFISSHYSADIEEMCDVVYNLNNHELNLLK